MKKIVLATKRRWSWKVFLVLLGLNILAVFAILPYMQNAYSGTDMSASLGWETLVLDRIVNILLIVVLGGIGMALANRIGLGMPFLEGWAKRQTITYHFRNIVAIAWIAAIILVLLSMFLEDVVFASPIKATFEELGINVSQETHVSPLYGFLTAISAGITEETLFRLFGLSLLAWLGRLLFHDSEGRPKLAVFWAANLLFAIAFGVAHLPTAAAMGLPINTLVVTLTLILNGMGGLAFGWLFWTFGLESAMLAHFLADVIKLTLIPLVTMPQGETSRILATGCLVVVVILTLIWALRMLIEESRSFHAQV
jgi:hypothetical protein